MAISPSFKPLFPPKFSFRSARNGIDGRLSTWDLDRKPVRAAHGCIRAVRQGAAYSQHMSRSAARVAEPARRGLWGLDVDQVAEPQEFILYRYRTEERRHSEQHYVAARVPYRSAPGAAIAEIRSVVGEIGEPTLKTLITQLSAKLASPRRHH